jgi:hypothetical protein
MGKSGYTDGTSTFGGAMIGAAVLGVSTLVLLFAWRQFGRRSRKGMDWSDNSPKPPSSHNLKR